MKKLVLLLFICPVLLFSQYGILDETFGESGKVISQVPVEMTNSLTTTSLTADQNQNIYVICNFTLNDEIYGEYRSFFIVKYLSTGFVDVNFGEEGLKKISIDNGSIEANDIIFTHDNKLAIVGSYKLFGEQIENQSYVINLDLDGNYVNSFGENGIYLSESGERDTGILLAQDNSSNYYVVSERKHSAGSDYLLYKINEEGILEETFGINGYIVKDVGSEDFPTNLKIADNHLYITGISTMYAQQNLLDHDACLLRYYLNGVIDDSFGEEGVVLTSYENTDIDAFSMDLDFNNEIYVGGTIFIEGSNEDFYVLNYHNNGVIDESFGENGIAQNNILDNDYPVIGIHKMGINNIVLTGNVYSTGGFKFALLSYNDIGELNQNFADNGILITDFVEGSSDRSFKSTKYGNDKILMMGKSGTNKIIMARYFVGENLSMFDAASSKSIQIIPNPTFNSFVISGLKGNRNQIQIVDLTGKLIRKINSVQENQTINLGSIPKGTYIVKINSAGFTETKKLIVK